HHRIKFGNSVGFATRNLQKRRIGKRRNYKFYARAAAKIEVFQALKLICAHCAPQSDSDGVAEGGTYACENSMPTSDIENRTTKFRGTLLQDFGVTDCANLFRSFQSLGQRKIDR